MANSIMLVAKREHRKGGVERERERKKGARRRGGGIEARLGKVP